MTNRHLLLISSSRVHGSGFLEHCQDAISEHFVGAKCVQFVPYALADHDAYEQTVAAAFAKCDVKIESIHHSQSPEHTINEAEGVFIGGGNSFRLLKTLYDLSLLDPIREVVSRGIPYMGSSAGTNMACPTIRTTNDMPIVEPPTLAALSLIPFQINPHFIDADPDSTHQGETREQRLREFHEENTARVAGLREGSWLEVHGDSCGLGGQTGMVLFEPGLAPQECQPGVDLSYLFDAVSGSN